MNRKLVLSVIFVMIILGITLITVLYSHASYAQTNINNTVNLNNIQNNFLLITNTLAKNLENHLHRSGAILEITSKLQQVRDVPYAHFLNQTLNTLHGIPQDADIEKRQVAKNIVSSNSGLYEIFFIMRNGDMYFVEPYSIQQTLTANNYAFRDYFQGTIKANKTSLGNVIISTAASGNREAVIAVPVYSLKDNSTLVGIWGGGINLGILDKELQSLDIISLDKDDNNTRVIYVDRNGQKVADSNPDKSKIQESFANLSSFKSALNRQSGSTIDTVDNTKMLVVYQPVNIFHNTWVVLLMQPSSPGTDKHD